jgi:transposase-like protein
VLTVGKDVSQVEHRLSAGLLTCPECAGRLHRWGHARARVLRGDDGARRRCCPRRARCAGCGRTHVLLPVAYLARRADVAAVIGAGLALAAAGSGHRRIAARLGRPAATVRGWLRRFRARAEPLRTSFIALLVGLDPLAVLPEAAVCPVGDAVAAIVAAAVATVARWGEPVLGLSPWELAAAVTSGRLLAPSGTSMSINTSCPW